MPARLRLPVGGHLAHLVLPRGVRSHGPLRVDDAVSGDTQLDIVADARDRLVLHAVQQRVHVQEGAALPVVASGTHINLVLGAGHAQRGVPVLAAGLTRGHAQHHLLAAHVLHTERLGGGAALVGAQELHEGAAALGDLQREGAGDVLTVHHGGHREGGGRQTRRRLAAHRTGRRIQRQTGR